MKEEYTKLMVSVDEVDSEDVITASGSDYTGGDSCWICYNPTY